MTDRELLELAAKAAEVKYEWASDSGCCIGVEGNQWNGGPKYWNPLTDDGDALRLAVKLNINIEFMFTLGGKWHGVNCWPYGKGDCAGVEVDAADPYAATRRAIVRAAAEIGKAMK